MAILLRCRIVLFGMLATASGCATRDSSSDARADSNATVSVPSRAPVSLDSLAIAVGFKENRAVSFTNKKSAYFYTQTNHNDHPEHAYFRGMNIAGRRVINDYTLFANGVALDASYAKVIVSPNAMTRTYPNGVVETFQLFDDLNAFAVTTLNGKDSISLRLSGDNVKSVGDDKNNYFYTSTNPADTAHKDIIAIGSYNDTFVIAIATAPDSARILYNKAASHFAELQKQRTDRMTALLNGDHYLWTDNAALTKSLRWITLTTDELITQQRGDGIYAGLPWFNEYWGRDSFISLAGATLVTGHFAEARAILTSFAKFQELRKSSPFYGRLPNIVKPGSIDYHTTDGTPRWVIALRDYVAYSGDTSIVAALYPNISASIEGALAHFTDASGYLTHADNETWMDARREPDHASYTPRATRANDIQALWYQQLRDGAEFALLQHDSASAKKWTNAANTVQSHFEQDFVDPAKARIADHLDAKNAPNYALRPNLLFALDMLHDTTLAARVLSSAWTGLVYPWGVATLAQSDTFFHPFHIAPEHYHKDEAYHNGTVWLWLNGIAMQRMIENNQPDIAWKLFQYTSDMALKRGVVGGLAETMDAFPHTGQSEPLLTGTFLQAWSNAEHLRVWYQYFLGVRPDLAHGSITLAPRMPDALHNVDVSMPIGEGALRATYEIVNGARRYSYQLSRLSTTLMIDIAPYEVKSFRVQAGDTVVADVKSDGIHVAIHSANGAKAADVLLARSAERAARANAVDAILRDTKFAAPDKTESHAVMAKTYTPPTK